LCQSADGVIDSGWTQNLRTKTAWGTKVTRARDAL